MADSVDRYRLTPRAKRDLEDIWLYTVDTWSADKAEDYHAGLIAAFARLAAGKSRGRRSDVRVDYWKYRVGSHVVFYKLTEDGIEVVRILHERMDVARRL
ncbi:MAG: type II toxin-antitoxin system RelE/ParE family toxin [Neorhizobium sp.]|nr:type II toxin-antitoxin system RelE/ParE family toxin [Neorhizobium sp.]